MPDDFLPPKICPLMSGPSGRGGISLEDCTSRCAMYDHGMCALLALLRREPAPPADAGGLADGCEHACRMGCRAYEPRVDWESLLAVADEMERKASNWDVTHGDIPLVHAGYLIGYADRIREALGVDDGR